MAEIKTAIKTVLAGPWPGAARSEDRVRRALLSTAEGHRSVIEPAAMARAVGMDARVLDGLLVLRSRLVARTG